VKLPRSIENGWSSSKEAPRKALPATLAIDLSFTGQSITHAAAVHGIEVSAEEARLARDAFKSPHLVGRAMSVTDGLHRTNSTN